MPHSSGGGSHHGGSHHSSSRHHRSGSSTSRISKTPYPSAQRYRYHHLGKTRYFYSTCEPAKLFDPKRLLLGIFYIPFLFGVVMMIQPVIRKQVQTYDTAIIIKDEADLLKEEEPLFNALNGFLEKTGIPPAVVTVNNETWMNSYKTLETYAYDRYLAEFNDEMHWLIVYSEPKTPDPSDIDWYWEGMQGDDTDDILTEKVTGTFNYDLQTRLENADTSITEDLTSAFNTVTKKTEKTGVLHRIKEMLPALFLLVFIGVHAYFMMGLYELKYRKAELAPEDETFSYDEYSK